MTKSSSDASDVELSAEVEARLRALEERVADELVDDPRSAIRTARELYRSCIAASALERAAAAIVLIAIAHGRSGFPMRALRVLALATTRAPEWHVPHCEIAAQHELLADRARARGGPEQARQHYLAAAKSHRRARDLLSVRGDLEGAADEEAREKWCLDEVASLDA
ncbi:MAG: hypothetical protein KF819_38370 [Labilithrix sp.]|nr:hypothetical protein [Labilithrix sp.]